MNGHFLCCLEPVNIPISAKGSLYILGHAFNTQASSWYLYLSLYFLFLTTCQSIAGGECSGPLRSFLGMHTILSMYTSMHVNFLDYKEHVSGFQNDSRHTIHQILLLRFTVSLLFALLFTTPDSYKIKMLAVIVFNKQLWKKGLFNTQIRFVMSYTNSLATRVFQGTTRQVK